MDKITKSDFNKIVDIVKKGFEEKQERDKNNFYDDIEKLLS